VTSGLLPTRDLAPDEMTIPSATRRSGHAVTDGRIAAADVLADLRDGRLLDAAFERRTAGLDARDRRWVQELTWGLLRNRETLDTALQARVRGGIARLQADLTDLLRLGAYQLLFMGGVPSYAAIAQTVELVKVRHGVGASRLANAVLRRIDRERNDPGDVAEGTADQVEALARRYSHPRWLVERWVAQFGSESTERLLSLNNQEAPVILRPWRLEVGELLTVLESSGVAGGSVPLVADSVRLPSGTALLQLGAWLQGNCYVQDPAASLVTSFAAFPRGVVAADLCAAPGSKALELSRTAGFVLAADRSLQRLARAADNLRRLGAPHMGLAVMDAMQPAIREVEAILLDVPCTGTGTFRRHPDARWRLRISDLAILAATQSELLCAAARHVKPGGVLVYSTCSLEPEENDAQVDNFLGEHADWTLDPPPPGTVPPSVVDHGRLRVLPQEHGTDGAFAARLRRAA